MLLRSPGRIKPAIYNGHILRRVLCLSALKNGAIHALIAQDPMQEGVVAMESAAKLIKGDKLDKTTLTEIVTIKAGDTATADKYEYKGDCD